ncbi:uncharacterized protein LOC141588934 [Silene latifolia]|uniref:uncharacterized protein LOC141588934 n=1 Tax=Silene latifolia TaxID=37657 RepID=UPI003D774F5F
MVTQRGIEASTNQIKAILQLESPQKPKDVQRLTGRVAALNRFIVRSSDRCRLFYDILRKSQKFEWTEEHEAKTQRAEKISEHSTTTIKAEHGEPLSLYLSQNAVGRCETSPRARRNTKIQRYYVVSPRYCRNQVHLTRKTCTCAVTTSYKLRPYFESHTISVVTNYPLKTIMRKPSYREEWPSGPYTEWLRSEIRTSDKESSPVLADFVSDFSPSLQMQAEKEILTLEEDKGEQMWELNVDGASNMKGAGVGLVLKSPQGDSLVQRFGANSKLPITRQNMRP